MIQKLKQFFKKNRSLEELFTLFILSLFMGYWAQETTQKKAIQAWEHAYQPSLMLLEALLHHYQMIPMTLSSDQRKILIQTLPQTSVHSGSFWISQNQHWMLYFSEQEHPHLYCWNCTQSIPTQWTPLGQGWKALDQWIQKIAIHLKPRPILSKKQKKLFFDSRAIHY